MADTAARVKTHIKRKEELFKTISTVVSVLDGDRCFTTTVIRICSAFESMNYSINYAYI